MADRPIEVSEVGDVAAGPRMPFDYAAPSADPIREDLVIAHRRAWDRISEAGTWWNGRERVAIAAEARAAEYCSLCRRRREALSPFSEEGDHDDVSGDVLPPAAIDAVHRIITDPTRLTSAWVESMVEMGVPKTHYVELVSVVVSIRSIDAFHNAMGLEPERLPTPRDGEPSRRKPDSAVEGEAWVPMLPAGRLRGEESDLWGMQTGNVIRALSLVPDAVRWLKELSAAHYLDMKAMPDFTRGRGPLSRAQTELIAGRVSAMNECFY